MKITQKMIRDGFRTLCESAGVDLTDIGQPVHALRHTCASMMAESGQASWSDIQAHLGHAQLSTTLNIYTHSMSPRAGGIAESIASAYGLDKSVNSK